MAKRLLLSLVLCSATVFAAAFDEDHLETIDGVKLHFRVRGEDRKNPYLVLLHGGPGFSAHMFYAWGHSLEKKLNVVYLDQWGNGESERLKFANIYKPTKKELRGYSISRLVKQIEGVRTFLKVDKWFVLGHSWGGMLGVEYVVAHPRSVSGYIHMDGLISLPMAEDALFDWAATHYEVELTDPDKGGEAKTMLAAITTQRAIKPGPTRLRAAFGYAFQFMQAIYFADPKRVPSFYADLGQEADKYKIDPAKLAMAQEPQAALEVVDHYATREVLGLLPKINVPTLVINGMQDSLITPETAKIVHEKVGGSKLLLLDSCGHFPFAEQPEKTTQAILAFVKGGAISTRRPPIVDAAEQF